MILLWRNSVYPGPWQTYSQFGYTWHTAHTDPTLIVPIGDCLVEVMYAIPISAKSNQLVFPRDNKAWEKVQKSAQKWRHEYTTIRFRVRDTYIGTFYTFHVVNKAKIVSLTIPGVQPFVRANETNNVFIIDIKKPTLELPKHYTMSVTYLNEQRLPVPEP